MTKRSRTHNTIINTLAGFLTRFANIIARFMLQSALIYVLGIQYTGISGLFTSILTILSLAELGIGSAIAFELYRPLEENNKQRIAALMNFYRSAYRLVAIIVLLVGVALIPFLGFFVKDVPDIKENIILIYMMYILKTVVSYLLIYKSTLLIANQKNYIVSEIQAAVSLLRTVIECILLFVTHQYITYLIMEIIGNVAQNVWISYVVDKKHPELKKHNKESLPAAEKKKLLWDIKSLAMYKAGFALGNGVDNIIISACVNTSAVGLVSNYTMIRKELEQLLKQFYNAMIPSVGNLSVTAPRDKQHEVFSNLMFLNFWISCFCSVSYFALIQPFISFWLGTKYVLPVTVAITLALDFYLACMMETIASFRTANGIFVKGQYRPLIMLIINLFLSVILGIRWGIAGVFAATVASRLLTQWYDPYLLYKLVFKRSPKQFYFRYYTYLIFTVSCAALVYLAAESISVNNLFLTLILRAILCVLVPNGLIVLVYNRTAEFRYCIAQAGKFVQKVRKKGKRDRV